MNLTVQALYTESGLDYQDVYAGLKILEQFKLC